MLRSRRGPPVLHDPSLHGHDRVLLIALEVDWSTGIPQLLNCTEESLAQALNYGKAHGKGYYAGKPRSVWAQGGLDAVIRGVREVRAQDPFHQFALENPAYSALRKDGQMIKYFGEGIVVQGQLK